MLIRCPTCACGYDLAPEVLGGPGRTLRCAACRESWTPSDIVGAPEIVAEARSSRHASPTPAPIVADRRAGRGEGMRRSMAGAAGTGLILGSVLAGMAAIAFKDGLVRLVPRSAGVFAAIGLPVNLRGLTLAGVHGTLGPDASRKGDVLTLEGRISNMRRAPNSVPLLRVAVRDKSRNELYSWLVPPPKSQLSPLETVVFHGRLAAPPQDGQDIVVSFAAPGEGATTETR